MLVTRMLEIMTDSRPTLGFVMHDVARFMRRRFEQHARGLGLTRSQWQVLAFLAPNEGIHQAGLAEILDIEGITLVRILDKLEAGGFVERRQHRTDRRIWLLYLTAKAHPVLARMRQLGDLTRNEALAGIPEDARNELMRNLCLMRKNLVAACEQPASTQDEAVNV